MNTRNDRFTRRTFLRASGVSLALPWIESRAATSAELPPRRMVTVCTTLGLHPPSWWPDDESSAVDSSEYLRRLGPHANDYTLFSGLSHPDQTAKQPHDTEMTWLSAAPNPGMGGFKNTISVDQVAAGRLGSETRFPSIALSSHGPKSQSYTAQGVMIPAEDSPARLFAKLFIQGDADEVRRQRQCLADGKSILDRVSDQMRSVVKNSGATDRHVLDEYNQSIRVAEQELVAAQSWLDRPKPTVEVSQPIDIADPADLLGRTELMFRMIPLILHSDSSRVISMVIQDHFVVPKIDGVEVEHHNLSHHGQDPNKIAQLQRIESELVTRFGDLLTLMKSKSEAGASLLDRTAVLFCSNLGNANAHEPTDLPILLAGGQWNHGRCVRIRSDRNQPLSNLFVSMLRHMDIETDHFASSTGELTWE